MAKQLVIVESPTKAKTLERYLGPDYSVTASKGHVRDLPEKSMGVDVDGGFRPEYVVPDEKKEIEQFWEIGRQVLGIGTDESEHERPGERQDARREDSEHASDERYDEESHGMTL